MKRRDFIIALSSVAACWSLAALAQDADDPPIPKAWLMEKTTVAEVEAANPGITDDRVKRFPDAAKPFGFENKRWEEFKAQIRPGDEIRMFASPRESWQHSAGRSGIALVRKGVPIKTLVTRMN